MDSPPTVTTVTTTNPVLSSSEGKEWGIGHIILGIAVILIIIIIILFAIHFFRRDPLTDTIPSNSAIITPIIPADKLGIQYQTIQQGVTTGNTDSLALGGSLLYIKRTVPELQLTFTPGRTTIGLSIYLVNPTTRNIQIIPGAGVTINPGIDAITGGAGVVLPSSYGQWIVTGSNTYTKVA